MLQADEIFAIKGTLWQQDPKIVLKSVKMYSAINFPLNDAAIQLINNIVRNLINTIGPNDGSEQ